MRESLRTVAAGAAGAVIASAVLLGQPALADHMKSAPKDSVNSKSIKNGSVKTKDLAADVNASLGKANSALQGIPDNGVTSPKLADNSVTNPKLADNAVGSAEVAADSLTAADLAANSVTSSELGANAVDGNAVENGSLGLNDVMSRSGFTNVNVPALANGACSGTLSLSTGGVTFGFVAFVAPALTVDEGLYVEGARVGSPSNEIDFRVCNRSGAAYAAASEQFLWGVLF